MEAKWFMSRKKGRFPRKGVAATDSSGIWQYIEERLSYVPGGSQEVSSENRL